MCKYFCFPKYFVWSFTKKYICRSVILISVVYKYLLLIGALRKSYIENITVLETHNVIICMLVNGTPPKHLYRPD